MKVAFLLACTCAVLTIRRVTCASIKAPLDIISLDDITETDRKQLEFLDSQYFYPRPKRSHHQEDLLSTLKSSISQGIKAKLGLIAKGSAAASSHLSKSSSGGHHSYHHHHDHHETYDHKSLDFWSLKKAILNTLLQAVKAIKGGVIAIKGQLIKGSGYLISAKGKLISAKGEAITKLGKNIATAAVLSHHGHSGGGHSEYDHDHYHHSSPESYGSHSAPGPEYDVPDHHFHQYHHSPHHEDKPDADHSGILILKKIPSHSGRGHTEHHAGEHDVPEFKPIDHSGPSLGSIVGKFFSASTSLKPGHPAPFGHTGPEHHHHDDDHDDSHSDYSSHSSHDEHHHGLHSANSHDSSHDHSLSGSHSKPLSTSYGTPFEEAPSFLNLEEYASESKTSLSKQNKPNSESEQPNEKPEKQKSQTTTTTTPRTFDEIRPLPTAFSNSGFDVTSALSHSFEKPSLFVGSLSDKPNVSFPPFLPTAYPTLKTTNSALQYSTLQDLGTSTSDIKYLTGNKQTSYSVDGSPQKFGAFPNTGSNTLKYLSANSPIGPQVFPSNVGLSAYRTRPQNIRPINYNVFLDTLPSFSQKVTYKLPPRSATRSRRHKKPPTYNVVRSVRT